MKKNIARVGLLTAAAGITMALATGPATAATTYYGAIAYNPTTGASGYAYDYLSIAAAQGAARDFCCDGCVDAVWVSDGCAAIATANNGAWGWGWAGSRSDAEFYAVGNTPGANPSVHTWVCTTNHQ